MALRPVGHFDNDAMRAIREGLGLTRAGLAELTGVHEDSIYEWESAKSTPSITNLPKLAEALKVSIEALYRTPGGRRLLGDIRAAKGISQKEFARLMNEKLRLVGDKTKITQTRVSNWERAKEPVPKKYLKLYADIVGVSTREVKDAVYRTYSVAYAPPLYRTPRIDRVEEDFKGVAAGSPELEFAYRMASRAYAMIAVLAIGIRVNPGGHGLVEDRLKRRMWVEVRAQLIEVRERMIAILDEHLECCADIVERVESSIWTLDQYYMIAEDFLGHDNEKLDFPSESFFPHAPAGNSDNLETSLEDFPREG